MSYEFDNRIVLILDAGGTNFVFSAMQGDQLIADKITLPACADDLEECLASLVKGFGQLLENLDSVPVAISFSFPGPADYPNGIISSDLPNFPAFKQLDGFPLGDYLQHIFQLPVFINNDGDLFAYGEAMFGILPEINHRLAALGSPKRFSNLLGVTLGTGFGAGIVVNHQLLLGDNSCGAEIFPSRNLLLPDCFVEESVSIRGLKRMYAELSEDRDETLTPKDIYEIAEGQEAGDRIAAIKTFELFGQIAGDTIANIISMIDGLIVIGGGLAGAAKFFVPSMLAQLNGTINTAEGHPIRRIPQQVFNLGNEKEFAQFAKGEIYELPVPGTQRTVLYDKARRIGLAVSRIGADVSIMRGAYSFALAKLDDKANVPKIQVGESER